MRRAAACFAVVMMLAIPARHAQAHKLHVFAAVDGKVLRGETYFRGGGAAAGVAVRVLGPAGQLLGETTTDDQGKFVVPVRFRCEHRVVVDTGGGHTAEYRIAQEELPADLPPLGKVDTVGGSRASTPPADALPAKSPPADRPGNSPGAGNQAAPDTHPGPGSQSAPHGRPEPEDSRPGPPSAGPTGDLGASLEALRTQVVNLRQEFDAFRQEIRIRDVLGGIGYILGVMGVVLYVVHRRRTGRG